MSGFKPFPKIPRLASGYIITEKIDGSNAAVVIEPGRVTDSSNSWCAGVWGAGDAFYKVGAQSRNRFITPSSDNFGFAAWVQRNAETLVDILGAGYHHGEWWGSGIQRGYGLPNGERRFSLFNVTR